MKIATAEKIGKHCTDAQRRHAKRALARARRTNERRAIRADRWAELPRVRRDFVRGWND
ncbi:MAG: hypothetical protein RID81_07095 [Sandaracinaceae bacterium]